MQHAWGIKLQLEKTGKSMGSLKYYIKIDIKQLEYEDIDRNKLAQDRY